MSVLRWVTRRQPPSRGPKNEAAGDAAIRLYGSADNVAAVIELRSDLFGPADRQPGNQPQGSAPRRPQALRSLSIRVTQIAAKGTIRPSAIEVMNNAPNWL